MTGKLDNNLDLLVTNILLSIHKPSNSKDSTAEYQVKLFDVAKRFLNLKFKPLND